MKKMLIIAGVLILLATVWGYQHAQNSKQALSIAIINEQNQKDEIHFTGIIRSISDQRPSDGPLVINVEATDGAMTSVVLGGGLEPQGLIVGTIVGFENFTPINGVKKYIGKTVQVFARNVGLGNPRTLTIVGNSKYYVKIVPDSSSSVLPASATYNPGTQQKEAPGWQTQGE